MTKIQSHIPLIPYDGIYERALRPLPETSGDTLDVSGRQRHPWEEKASDSGVYRYYVKQEVQNPVYNTKRRMVSNEQLMKGRWIDIYV